MWCGRWVLLQRNDCETRQWTRNPQFQFSFFTAAAASFCFPSATSADNWENDRNHRKKAVGGQEPPSPVGGHKPPTATLLLLLCVNEVVSLVDLCILFWLGHYRLGEIFALKCSLLFINQLSIFDVTSFVRACRGSVSWWPILQLIDPFSPDGWWAIVNCFVMGLPWFCVLMAHSPIDPPLGKQNIWIIVIRSSNFWRRCDKVNVRITFMHSLKSNIR